MLDGLLNLAGIIRCDDAGFPLHPPRQIFGTSVGVAFSDQREQQASRYLSRGNGRRSMRAARG
jgi:hypothetical protein